MAIQPIRRIQIWYGFFALIIMVFGLRLFYVQVIRYSYYKNAALSDQLKQYQIPASRGIIEAYDGGQVVPIVLNQTLYTLYADPPLVKNPDKIAASIAATIGGTVSTYVSDMKVQGTEYSVLAAKISAAQSNAILALKYPGIGTEAQDYRIYPQGSLASQVLGFVNNQGVGEYGIEQAENPKLAGTPGQVKAITDVNGVPLAATKGNIETAPKNGDNLVLTLNLSMQEQMEQILQNEYKATKSQGINALIMNPNTGQIEAMANYPPIIRATIRMFQITACSITVPLRMLLSLDHR
jgi:cell division protein FtsI/penicillin-binding protein 2